MLGQEFREVSFIWRFKCTDIIGIGMGIKCCPEIPLYSFKQVMKMCGYEGE